MLDIFDLYQNNHADTYDIKDQALVYVCRRWRQIMSESPRRLGLRVCCTYGTPVKKSILIWPNIPIAIDYCSALIDTSPDDEESIIAALEHSDRVGYLGLHLTDSLLGKLGTFIQKPFPTLTHLILMSYGEHTPILPAEFLGGSAPCLQQITLSFISFPALPTLLSSARDLVTLNLCQVPPTDYISPEALVAYLAALTRLETFDIRFQSTTPYPDQIQAHPTTRTVLHALTDFQLDAAGKYLEDFTARIDCPRLNSFYLVYFIQLQVVNFQATQLVMFFERLVGPETSPFKEAKVRLDPAGVILHTYRPNNHPGWDWHLARTTISSQTIDWQASPLTRMLRHFSPILSSILYLKLVANYILVFPYGEPDVFDWLRLLQQFSAVRALCVSQPLAGRIAHSLKSFTGEMVAEALSSLDLIYLEKRPASCLEKFTAIRQLSGRPVTVVDTVEEFDQRLECYLENEGKEKTYSNSVS